MPPFLSLYICLENQVYALEQLGRTDDAAKKDQQARRLKKKQQEESFTDTSGRRKFGEVLSH
jgi:hypothetical protein